MLKARWTVTLNSYREVLRYHDYWVRVQANHVSGPYRGPKIPRDFYH